MLTTGRALFYYESLRFNHYESGGTCEQRVLVLRARFDRILDEIVEKDTESRNFYVEGLKQIFTAFPTRFTHDKQIECQAMRKYLNGIQHATYTADETQYIKSLHTLCDIIYLCSDVEIPKELQYIWNERSSDDGIKQVNRENKIKTQVRDFESGEELPIVLCLDCLMFEHDEVGRKLFVQSLSRFVSEISAEAEDAHLLLVFFNNHIIRYVVPKNGKVSNVNIKCMNGIILTEVINNICGQLEHRLSNHEKNRIRLFNPSAIIVMMLSSTMAGTLDLPQKTIVLENNKNVKVLPIGLDKGMDLTPFKNISVKNQAVVLKKGELKELFSWLVETTRIICNHNI